MSKRKNGLRASVRALSSSIAASTGPGVEGAAPPADDDGSNVAVCPEGRGAGFHGDHLHAPDGRTYRRVKYRITPSRARELLLSGAAMVVDDCGCHGYCGLEWPSPAECLELGRRPPRLAKSRFGWLEEWLSGDGHRLLSQHGDVRLP